MSTLGGKKVNQSHIAKPYSESAFSKTYPLYMYFDNEPASNQIDTIFDEWNYEFATYKILKPLYIFWMFQLGGRIRIYRRNESEFEVKW